jgi:hypothetical protein
MVHTTQGHTIRRFAGTPAQVGLAHGRALGPRLDSIINNYVGGLIRSYRIDLDKLRAGALPWLNTLPERYREELAGMAEGAQLPLVRLAEWYYVELCVPWGCSSAVGLIDGRAWIARNNDADWIRAEPGLWGHAVIREIDGRLPTMIFGLEGDCFGASGVNARRLWVHPDGLPDADGPGDDAQLPTWIWCREALETCAGIADVERLLSELPRNGGMNLVVVDGKTEEAALFECSGRRHLRREAFDGWLLAPNPYRAMSDPAEEDEEAAEEYGRFRRLRRWLRDRPPAAPPDDLISLLADPEVEAGREIDAADSATEFGTVYANVACPSTGEVWSAAGGFPAASAGRWQRIPWPWVS